MNIVLITSSFPYGGASANLLRYFTYCLEESGFNIEVFLPTGAYYGKKVDQFSKRQGKINGVKYTRLGFIHHPVNYFGKFLDIVLGMILSFFYLLNRKLSKKIDMFIVYNVRFTSFILYLIIKNIIGIKLLVILPEFYEKPQKKISLAMLKWYDFYYGIKILVRYADLFIVLSSYLKKYLVSKDVPINDIFIMPNLCEPNRFNIQKVESFKKDFITIGYVGTPTRKDGILDLINSFSIINKKYPNTHLLVIGDITNRKTMIPQLRQYAYNLGIKESYITFKGLTSNTEIPKLLLSCQILSLTRPNGISAEAGFPTKLGEYFACKKPVVITRVGDMRDYFYDKKEVVFAEPENINSIVEAFEFLIKNPKKANEIGLSGYKWMDKNLNYQNQSNRIRDFIDKIAN